MSLRYLVTIDREEWEIPHRFHVWKENWWIARARRAEKICGIGRTVFEVNRESGEVHPLFEVPQLLDRQIYRTAWTNKDDWLKSFTRGLRSITHVGDGTIVLNDIFGIYQLSLSGGVQRYLTLPMFADLHSALPNHDNTRILLTSTGVEEVQEVDWNGGLHHQIGIPEVYGIDESPKVIMRRQRHPDLRTTKLNFGDEFFHVNWAEWIDEGDRMLVSLYTPGAIAILRRTVSDCWHMERKWEYFPQCHGPVIDWQRGTLLVSVSAANQVKEIDLETGKTLWTADNLQYTKRIRCLDSKRAVASDCNGRRIVELDRDTGEEIWDCSLPGIPYDIEILSNS